MYFNIVDFDRHPFACSREAVGGGGGGGLNYFKFGTLVGRFPSDGAASMCSERVNILITVALNGER